MDYTNDPLHLDHSHAGYDSAADALLFLFGGKAIFTITSLPTGKHYTYEVSQGKPDERGIKTPFFVRVLTSSDNTSWDKSSSVYIGFIPLSLPRELVTRGKGQPKHPASEALAWAIKALTRAARDGVGDMPTTLRFQHAGRCCQCKKILTDPISVELGIGPICRRAA